MFTKVSNVKYSEIAPSSFAFRLRRDRQGPILAEAQMLDKESGADEKDVHSTNMGYAGLVSTALTVLKLNFGEQLRGYFVVDFFELAA